MKSSRLKKPKRPSDLVVKNFPGRKVITFPLLAGRTVERVRFYSGKDDHSVSINFQDKTLLSLHFDLGFTLKSSLSDIKTGNIRTIREWPPIPSSP